MLNVILFSSLLFAEEPVVTPAVETVETTAVEETLPEIKPALLVDADGKPLVIPAIETVEEKAPTEEKVEEPAKEVEVPEDYNEAAETVSLLVKAVQDKNWALAIGLLLTLLVFVANKFGLREKVGAKAVPWVATGLATAAALGVSFANGLPVSDAISQGILAGLTAIGGWEMIFKHFLAPAKTEEVKG